MIYAIVLVAVLCAIICHTIAKKRGANPVFWGVMGAVFGPFAIPFVYFARTKSGNERRR